MNPDRAQEISERDQLWAALRNLRPEIDLLADGKFDGSERQQHVIILLAKIVKAEIDFRRRDTATES
jgi:hypothetical protein